MEIQSSLMLLALGVVEVQDDVANISTNLSSLTQSISDVNNSAMITKLTVNVDSLTSSDQQQETRIEENVQRLESLSTQGRSE